MGNPFRFGSFDPTPGAERFPRPDTEGPPNRGGVTPPRSLPERKTPFRRPASTTLSDTDSDREKELEHMRIHMLSLENGVRRANEEKQKSDRERQRIEAENARLQNQQPQAPQRLPIPDPQMYANGRTPEQLAAREFVEQWSNGHPQPAHNDTQSTMTGLAGQFGNLHVHHA
jgi:hypothetical protein